MFNPGKLDEACAQDMHHETRGKQNIEENGESEGKGKRKEENGREKIMQV